MKKAASSDVIARASSPRHTSTCDRVLRVGFLSLALVGIAAPVHAEPPAGASQVDPAATNAAQADPAASTPSTGAPNTDPPAPASAPSTGAPVVSLHDPANPSAAPNDQSRTSMAPPSDVRDDVPVIALTHSAFGSRSGKVGAHGFGYATGASGGSLGGGGLTVYGSPVNRLTLLATAERFSDKRFAPSASLAYRILGSLEDGWALAAMGTYKAEGFAEVEGEVELGAMFSLMQNRWHLDFNAVAGGGFEESEEFDAEAKLRLGYDVIDWLRLGLDSRGRYRLRGARELAGGRKGDFIGGPQAVVSWSQFYAAVLAGVSTVDISSNVGGTGWLTVGGQLP